MTPLIRRTRRTIRRGFTILELLIVIGILVAIGGLVLYNVLGASEKADVKLAAAQIQAFESALENFKFDMKRWPTEEEGIVVLWSKDQLDAEEDQDRWGGPYLKEPKPHDTWGNEWVFRQPSSIEGRPYDIISPGPDKQEGTEDDISNQDGKGSDEGFDDFGDFGSDSGGG